MSIGAGVVGIIGWRLASSIERNPAQAEFPGLCTRAISILD